MENAWYILRIIVVMFPFIKHLLCTRHYLLQFSQEGREVDGAIIITILHFTHQAQSS